MLKETKDMTVSRTSSVHAGKRAVCLAMSAALALSCLGLAGCAGAESDAQSDSTEATGAGTLIADVANMDREYTKRDLDPSYDAATATHIDLDGTTASVDDNGAETDGSAVTINAEGTYILSGSLSNGQVVVDAADTDKIQVVLDGVTIHNENGPAIYIKQADKCFITLADDSTNMLTDGTSYSLEDDSDEPYATLFSKDDLTINGSGALTVDAAYRHGIASKDDLVITGGTINVTAAEDALRGRDCVKIADGAFAIDAGADAIKSNNDEDNTRGFVSIDGGSFAIKAGDDAVHGEFALFVEDGQIDVSTCYEGLEAQQVYVNGGTVNIVSSDDSINASSPGESTNSAFGGAGDMGDAGNRDMRGNGGRQDRMQQDGMTPPNMNGEAPSDKTDTPPGMENGTTSQGDMPADKAMGNAPQDKGAAGGMGMAGEYEDGCLIEINGGEINLITEGDGVDSNGDLTMNGGTLYVSGPTTSGNGSLDVAGNAEVNGGTVLMAGAAGMAESFSGGSQAYLQAKVSGKSGETITITSASGEEVISFTPKAQFSIVLASAPSMKSGETYTITAGQSSATAQAK